jgi:molybdopterin molybdotransferase
MLTVTEAIAAVLARTRPLAPVRRPLESALGCVLAEEVVADADSPPFDKALVDGYAVRACDLAVGNVTLTVVETILAGQVPTQALRTGEAAEIMTGAPVPTGCDAVVMREHTRAESRSVMILETGVRSGQNLLKQGREMCAGEVVAGPGMLLTPASVGLLAAVGHSPVKVVPPPDLSIVPTGDELVEFCQVPGPGQIRNSSALMLEAMAREAGARPEVFPIVRDDSGLLRDALARAIDSDVAVITGGVSAGARDLVPDALADLGVDCVFHKVRLKPGKPLWFGVGPRRAERPGALVFGLPGNPVSGLVGFLLFVRQAVAILAGLRGLPEGWLQVQLSGDFKQRGDRMTFYPSRLVGGSRGALATVETLPWGGSADLRTIALADGFAIFPAGDRDYSSGDVVEFLPLR